MDRKYINNINSFVAKRFAVRKCGNAYYAMQKDLRNSDSPLLQTTNVRFELTISRIRNKLIIKDYAIQMFWMNLAVKLLILNFQLNVTNDEERENLVTW